MSRLLTKRREKMEWGYGRSENSGLVVRRNSKISYGGGADSEDKRHLTDLSRDDAPILLDAAIVLFRNLGILLPGLLVQQAP